MPDIRILEELIKPEARVAIENENGRNHVDLHEIQTDHPPVRILGLPDDSIVVKVDFFNSHQTIFSGARGECKLADFVIVANSGRKKRIIYIELKKKRAGESDICSQLRGAQCFVRYCQEIGKTFWQARDFLQNYEPRFISIGHISINKGKTRAIRDKGRHDTPEKMMKISRPNLSRYTHFEHLAG